MPDVGGKKPGPSRYAVTLIPGDGVGPEITRSVVRVFEAADVPIDWDVHQMSYLTDTDEAKWYLDSGVVHSFGSAPSAAFNPQSDWSIPTPVLDSLYRNGFGIKGTLFTPIEQRYKVRKTHLVSWWQSLPPWS